MKIYYIFIIKDSFRKLYKHNGIIIFNLLETMYNSKDYDLMLSVGIYKQAVSLFSKKNYDNYIWNIYNENSNYSISKKIHYINLNSEKSGLMVYNSHIRIATNVDFPIFLYDINHLSKNAFVCEFQTKEFFWLSNSRNILKKESEFSKM